MARYITETVLQYGEVISESANKTTTYAYDLMFPFLSKIFVDLSITFADCFKYLSNKQN